MFTFISVTFHTFINIFMVPEDIKYHAGAFQA